MEIASRDFENQFIKLINNNSGQPKIYEKLKALLKKWAEGDFKTDPQLNLIPSLYQKLKSEGHDFSTSSEKVRDFTWKNKIIYNFYAAKLIILFLSEIFQPPRPSYAVCKDPNVVTSTQEEEEIAKGN